MMSVSKKVICSFTEVEVVIWVQLVMHVTKVDLYVILNHLEDIVNKKPSEEM